MVSHITEYYINFFTSFDVSFLACFKLLLQFSKFFLKQDHHIVRTSRLGFGGVVYFLHSNSCLALSLAADILSVFAADLRATFLIFPHFSVVVAFVFLASFFVRRWGRVGVVLCTSQHACSSSSSRLTSMLVS